MNYLPKIHINRKAGRRAFTIVETLVAISILVVAVLGPMVIISQALKISFFARDQMTSFYLAQEPIEYIRNIRDKNALTPDIDPEDWLVGIASDGDITLAELNNANPQKYQLVYNSSGDYVLKQCQSNTCPKLKVNTVTGLYGEEAATANNKDSIYTREITFSRTPGDTDDLALNQEMLVSVNMKWDQVGGSYSFRLHEFLSNWKIQSYDEN